jgi:hypothetical protein
LLASEAKLAANNLAVLVSVLDALRIVRENGGYGSVELKVKDGLVVYARKIVEDHLTS